MNNMIDKPYKAVQYKKHHQNRYRIVSTETGKVLDDAQGYGYRSAKKAYASYAFKIRNKGAGKKEKHIKQWMDEHKSFVALMDEYAFLIAKGSMGPDDKFDEEFVKELLLSNDLETDFAAYDLLKIWKKNQ